MNSRQRKKRTKKQQLTIFVGCTGKFAAEDYEKMRKSIEYQLKEGNVVILPRYLHVETIIKQVGNNKIVIKHESEVKE